MRALAKTSKFSRGRATLEGHSRRNVRITYRPKSTRIKSVQARFLLADSNKRAALIVKTCEACQKFTGKLMAPSQPIHLIALVWPLQLWGIDIVGPLTVAQGNYKYTIVAIECFSKCIEAKPVTNITAATITKFF